MNSPLSHLFDSANAAELVWYAKAAYWHENRNGRTGLTGRTEVIEDSASDTRVVLSIFEEDLVVAFRGTRSLANFVTDARCRRVALFAGSTAEVHEGFYLAFQGIRNSLHKAIVNVLTDRRNRRIWFTGHSLGGALAKLAAFHFASPLTSVHTFGEPRVGNAAFRDLYDSQLLARTFRVVHADDVVPRIPWLLGAYRHSGHEVYFESAGSCPLIDPSPLRKAPCDAITLYQELRQGKLALLADHHMDTYCRLFAPALNPNLSPTPSLS